MEGIASRLKAAFSQRMNLVASAAYEPFGEFYSLSGTLTNLNRYWFSSKEWHPQSELYLYEFRQYKPKFQRWMTEDPLGIAGGINLYRFVENSPIAFIDPWGLKDYTYEETEAIIARAS